MIYISADDYGLCDMASKRIQHCIDEGALNKVSIFPNLDPIDLNQIIKNKNIRVSLHLNLIEGQCMSKAEEIDLLVRENGDFQHDFGGLFKLNLFNGKKLEEQAYKEIKAQVLFWKEKLPLGTALCVDGHQHTHMIPAVFRALLRVLRDEKIELDYIRIPSEPIMPYIKAPSLYFSYSAVNLIKQWLLKCLWIINKKKTKKQNIPTAYFCGILFSGHMDEARVSKILPEYMKLAEKNGRDIEILFHPGYLSEQEVDLEHKNIAFEKFYFSKNRKTEYDSVMKISERRVL